MSITGTQESGPTRVGTAIGDYFTGVFAALGTVLALYNRAQTGQGQRVDASLLETLVGCLGVQASTYLATGERPQPQGNFHPTQSPYGSFKTKDSYVMIAAGNQGMWERLAKCIGREGLVEDERFLTVADRVANRPVLAELIEEALAEHTTTQWLADLEEAGVASGPILYVDEVFKDPQVLHQEMLKKVVHPVLGELKTTGFSANLSDTPADIRKPPPLLGEHTDEILSGLGYGREDIDRLRKSGIV